MKNQELAAMAKNQKTIIGGLLEPIALGKLPIVMSEPDFDQQDNEAARPEDDKDASRDGEAEPAEEINQ